MDNLLQISQKVNTDIDPNGAPESILAQNHNDILQMFLRASGKYMGLPYIIKTNYQGVISPGELFVSGAFNTIITAFISPKTTDGTDTQPILNIYKNGDFFHLKDFAGRSVYFTITNILDTIDNNSNQVFALTLEPFPSNINYSYQNAEQQVGVVELIKSGDVSKNFFQGVEIDLFWNRRGFASDRPDSDFWKEISRQKYIDKDPTGLEYYRTLKTRVYHLGVEVKNYDLIKDFKPRFLIERYKRPRRNYGNRGQGREQANSPAGYKFTQFFSDQIYTRIPNGWGNIERPVVFDIVSKQHYYDIRSENYFSQVDPPKALGNQHFVTFPKPASIKLNDDSVSYSRVVPKKRKGHAHCRIRMIIDTPIGTLISEPMVYFKITNQMLFDDIQNESDVIKYSFE